MAVAWQRNLATTTANPRNLQQFTLIKIKILTQKHTYKYRNKENDKKVKIKELDWGGMGVGSYASKNLLYIFYC